MKRWIIACAIVALVTSAEASGAQTTQPVRVELGIRPAAPEEPALKYRLMPAAMEQTPGDGATLYMMAFQFVQSNFDSWQPARRDEFDHLVDASPDDLDADKADSFRTPGTFEFVRLAGHRAQCNWGPAVKEKGYHALLPYLNYARVTADLLSVQIKLDIKQGRFDDAIEMLRSGFAMADNFQREPILVQCLLGEGLREVMMDDLRDLIQRPGAPNLYWPLAGLHSSEGLLHRIAQSERDYIFYTFPSLKHPEELNAEQSRKLIDDIDDYIDMSKGSARTDLLDRRIGLILQMIHAYPEAKTWMIRRGIPPQQVETMPANAVVLAWALERYQYKADAIEKWTGLPAWQAFPGMQREIDAGMQKDDEWTPLKQLLPSYFGAYFRFGMADRERAALQIVEGIRGYAATHGGAAPASLDDLSPATPAPLDPLLGKPFGYVVENNVITLRAPSPAGTGPQWEMLYRVTLAH